MHTQFFKYVTLTATLSIILSCQPSNTRTPETTYFELVGPVKTVRHLYDYSYQKSKEDVGQIKFTTTTFNQKGQLLSGKNEYTEQKNSFLKNANFKYTYDDKDRIIKQKISFGAHEEHEITYLYRNEDSPYAYASIKNTGDNSEFTQYKQDSNGNLLSVITINEQFHVVIQFSAKYNTENQIVFSSNVLPNFKLTEKSEYNQSGYLSSKTSITNDDSKSVLTYEYLKTDEHGNWTKRKAITEGQGGYVIENRQVIYY